MSQYVITYCPRTVLELSLNCPRTVLEILESCFSMKKTVKNYYGIKGKIDFCILLFLPYIILNIRGAFTLLLIFGMGCDVEYMDQSDVNRRARIFDRPNGNGLIGKVIEVYTATSFRFQTDSGQEYDFSTDGHMSVRVQWIGDA